MEYKFTSFKERGSHSPLFFIAYGATLLLPWMLIFFRVGAELCCAAIALTFLVHSYRQRQWDWLSDPVLVVCLVTYLWMLVVVTPLAVDVKASFSIAVVWVRYPLLYIALKHWVLAKRESLYFLGMTLIFMLIIIIGDTLFQYVSGHTLSGKVLQYERLTGPFDSYKVGIFIAKFLLPIAGISLFFCIGSSKKITFFVLLVLFSAFAAILLSGERTAFISITLGILTTVMLLALTERQWRIPCIAMLIAFLATGEILYFTQNWVEVRITDLIHKIIHFRDTDYNMLFQTGIEIGRQHMFSGAGFKGFRELCPQMLVNKPEFCNLHPHNPYIEWFAETGLIGLGLFIGIIVVFSRTALKHFLRQRGAQKLLPALAIGVLMVNFFPFLGTQSFFSNWPGILLWYTVGLAFAMLNLLGPSEPDRTSAVA